MPARHKTGNLLIHGNLLIKNKVELDSILWEVIKRKRGKDCPNKGGWEKNNTRLWELKGGKI